MLDKQKKFAEAEAVFRQLIAKEPDNAPALNYLGYMLAERGERLDESVDYLKRALAIDPDNGSYLDSIGWAYFKDGKLDLALDNLKRAADQLTTNSVVQDHYGDVLFKLGRFDDAIAAWTRALAGDGDSIDRGDIDKKIRSPRGKSCRSDDSARRRLRSSLRSLTASSCGAAAHEAAVGPGAACQLTARTRSTQATAACRAHHARSRAEIAVSGRSAASACAAACWSGSPRQRRPTRSAGAVRRPVFIFAAVDDDATLLLPRDQRVLEHGRPADVLEAVAGVPLDAGRLRATLTGCVADGETRTGAHAARRRLARRSRRPTSCTCTATATATLAARRRRASRVAGRSGAPSTATSSATCRGRFA